MLVHNTPTHASWRNQVELFFSILQRRMLRNGESTPSRASPSGSFTFINDCNRRAAPFRWTYDGRPLKVGYPALLRGTRDQRRAG